MKEKNKKILSGFLEMIGYSSAITYTGLLTWFVYQVHKNGGVILREPNEFIRWVEMIAGSTTVGFLIYKFFQSLKKREKELIQEALKV